MACERVEQHGERVAVIFTDGTRAAGDLVIGADGFRSAIRNSIMPEVQPKFAGYIAWRGMVEEGAMPRCYGDAAFVARPHVGMGTTRRRSCAVSRRRLLAHRQRHRGCNSLVAPSASGSSAAVQRDAGSATLEAQIRRTQRSAHELAHMPLDKLLREVGAALRDIPALAEVA